MSEHEKPLTLPKRIFKLKPRIWIAIAISYGVLVLTFTYICRVAGTAPLSLGLRDAFMATTSGFLVYRVFYELFFVGLKSKFWYSYRDYFCERAADLGMPITPDRAEGPDFYGKLKHERLKKEYASYLRGWESIVAVVHACYFSAIATLIFGAVFLRGISQSGSGRAYSFMAFILLFAIGLAFDYRFEKKETEFFKEHEGELDKVINQLKSSNADSKSQSRPTTSPHPMPILTPNG